MEMLSKAFRTACKALEFTKAYVHALALGNSPADLAQVAGHRTEQLLNTYAKPTGKVLLPSW